MELALRQQLGTYARKRSRPRLTALDRGFWIALSSFWPPWKGALVIVKPDTVVRWHRKGFRLYWRTLSKRGPGRPPISGEVQALIVRLARENGWRARKLQAELEKLGFSVSLATVSRYLPTRRPDEQERQRWITFLRNHRDVITGMDFLVVPTIHRLSKSMAERNGRAMGGQRPAGAAGPRDRYERAASAAAALRIRRLLQHRSRPHPAERFSGESVDGASAVAERRSHRPAACGRSSPPIRLEGGSIGTAHAHSKHRTGASDEF